MAKELTTTELNELCCKYPSDLNLKLRTISASLEDLRKIYVAGGEVDVIAKVNERLFDEFSKHFDLENARSLNQKLEVIRNALEPEGYGVNFLSAYENLSENQKLALSENQSSSVAIVNYLSARLGLGPNRGFNYLKNLFFFRNIQDVTSFLFIIITLFLSVIFTSYFLDFFNYYLTPNLHELIKTIVLFFLILALPCVLFYIFIKLGFSFGQRIEDRVLGLILKLNKKKSDIKDPLD